jgi:hypothetical protein
MFMREANKLNLGSVTTRNKAIKWWDKLSKSQKFHYEHKMFGYGGFMEDPTITEEDIIKMYQSYGW